MIRSIKRLARRKFPLVLSAYHGYRRSREMAAVKPGVTPLGFSFAGHDLMVAGTFEPEESKVIGEFAAPGRVVVDVGANYGYHVCIARSKGSHVVAIEPLAENLEILFANLEANGWSDVEIFPVGVAEEPGVAKLYGGGTAASLIANWSGTSETFNRRIALSTLDRLLAGNRFDGQQMLIKIDVEGAELGVLRGARETLRRTPRPQWLLEITFDELHPAGANPHFRDIFELFWSEGYEAESVSAGFRVVTRADVDRWLSSGKRDFGYVAYRFRERRA
jgi:FkbM family methyltransferase